MSNEELVEINHFGNLFIEKLIQFNIRGLTIDNLTKRRIDDDLSKLNLVQIGISDLLIRQLVENQLDIPYSTQSNDIPVSIIKGVNFLKLTPLRASMP